MKGKLSFSIALILIASILPDLILQAVSGSVPKWLIYLKAGLLVGGSLLCLLHKQLSSLSKLSGILLTITLVQIVTNTISASPQWISAFNTQGLIGQIGSNILLKFIGVMPVLAVLLLMFRQSEDFYLSKGDLSVKADKIAWLGISPNKISWGKLSVISAVLISLGTVVLAMGTAIGFSIPKGLDKLPSYLPVIILFALCNSFCEGIIYRNAILGGVKNVLPRHYMVLLAALFFGIAHVYGIPGGPLGAIMSGLLGWYMCRSMTETNGFVSAWIIHFMQDFVVFTTLCVLN